MTDDVATAEAAIASPPNQVRRDSNRRAAGAQLIVVAGAKGMVEACEDGNAHPVMLRCLQQNLASDADLASGYAHLLSLVGATDVIIVLDRALARLT